MFNDQITRPRTSQDGHIKYGNPKMDLTVLLRVCLITTCATALSVSASITNKAAATNFIENNPLVLQLLQRVERIESRDRDQQSEIDVLREQLRLQKQRTSALENIIRRMKTTWQNNKKKEKVVYVTETTAPPAESKEPSSDVAHVVANSKNTNRIRRTENEVNVAFFSTLTNHIQHVGANQNIAFDNVVTNVGNAYNNHAGLFIAPVQGTYVFSTTLMAYGSRTDHFSFVRNGAHICNLFLDGSESPYQTSSQTVVLQLKQGDDVSIQNVDADQPVHGAHYNTFGGFLLYQEYSNPNIVGK